MKIQGAFDQLFHGNAMQTVYFTVGTDEAEIRDIYHGDVRTEGQGLGMMIAVQLAHRDEFDRLWRHAKTTLAASGLNAGYFDSSCDSADGVMSQACIDPYGMEQFAMSLIFAHGRWGSDGAIDYEGDVLELLDVMRNKEERNGGVMEGVTNVFNAETALVPHEPKSSVSTFTRPSIEIPAYYALWAQATGDAFWTRAADAGRTYLKNATNATTWLMPLRAYMDGSPVTGAGWDAFRHEAYRNELNFALDEIWIGSDPWNVEEADRLVAFFFAEGIDTYGKAYTLDGTMLDMMRETALIVTNGTVAGIATRT
jgi:oligosaccharide reducing-end xylanase